MLMALYSLFSLHMFAYADTDSLSLVRYRQMSEGIPTVPTVHHRRNLPYGELLDTKRSVMLSDFGKCFTSFNKYWKINFNVTTHTISIDISNVRNRDFSEFICKCGAGVQVSWKLITEAIMLSKSILLTCFYRDTECTNTDIKSWWVGIICIPLCINGTCRKSNKYKMVINHIDMSFNLEILDVNNLDLERSYTCTCGKFKKEQHINLPVQWSAKADTIIFRETNSLICEYHSDVVCPSNSYKTWRSYKTDKMLCADGNCFNEKYKMTFDDNKIDGKPNISILEIKNFTEEDVREYTCSCNFASFTKNIEEFDYMNMPENFKRSASYREKQVIIQISTEKVFPVLKCNETYYKTFSKCRSSVFCNEHSSSEKKHVLADMKLQHSYKVSNFTFYKVKGDLIVDTNGITCSNITLEVKCFVGNRPFSFSLSTEIRCNGFETYGQYIIAAGSSVLLFFIIIFLCCKFKIRRKLKRCLCNAKGLICNKLCKCFNQRPRKLTE